MADIVIAIAAEVAKALVKPAIRQGQYLFCVNKVIRDLDNEKEELMSKRDSILSLVEQAIQRTEIIEVAVNKWLSDVESLLGEVEKLEQDVKESSCFQGWCPTWRRYRLCREISKKTERITAFKNRERFEPFSHPPPLPGIEYDTSKNFTYFESTKVAYNQLLEALKDDNTYMIGLYGMGGSGKTTLATEVGEKAKSEMNLFDQVISVTASQTPNIRSIQGKMADMLNLKLEKETEEGRARELWLRLKAEKQVLIIVDDVWKMFNLKEIGIRLDDNDKLNFKVLLTTRQRQVCVSMGCQKAILLDLLSKTEGWSLFTKHAGIGDGSPSNLLEVARKVSDECKGLPIAIKAVGSSLKEKGFDEWKVALERLRNPDRFDDNEEEGFIDAFTCLKLSYDYLRNKKAKMLFLMCSMFPEDHEISIEDLIRYGGGLGLFGDFISFDLARSCIRAGINKLVHSCLLFYNEKEDHVKMHDVARDVALCIASRVEDRKILMNLVNDLNAFAISSWYEETSLISYQLDAPRLEILMLQTRNENSLDFSFASSNGVKELKVMSILNSYYSRSLLLLQSTQWLTNLRTLRLSGWNLGDLSFLISLTRLEALDLRNCHFTELPKGMEKLNKLKLLDLSGFELPKNFNYDVLISFSQLEELYVSSWRIPSEVIKDIVTLPNLQRFWITEFLHNVDYGENTRVLSLHDFNISDFGASKQNLLQKAEDVSLQGLQGGCKNVIPDMVRVVGGMNELINLCFRSCSEIECLIDTTYLHVGSFQVDTLLPKLVRLELSNMDNLKEVCRGPPLLALGFFEKLEQLFIMKCQLLHSIFPEGCNLCNLKILTIGDYHQSYHDDGTAVVSLFSLSVAQSLKQLEGLSIEGCKELKQIIKREADGGGSSTGDNSQLMFPKLKKLSVRFCPKLEFIFPISFAIQGPSQLQEIEVSHASELKYVFGQYEHEAHSSHENLVKLADTTYLHVGSFQVETLLPKLVRLELSNMDNLKEVCGGPPLLVLGFFEKLEELFIRKCHQFHSIFPEGCNLCNLKILIIGNYYSSFDNDGIAVVSLFSLSVAQSLQQLEELSIAGCKELKHIIKREGKGGTNTGDNSQLMFPKLKKLSVNSCPKLEFIFPISFDPQGLLQLQEIKISHSSGLKYVFGQDDHEAHSSHGQIMLPSLNVFQLYDLENLLGICPENYHLRYSSSVKLGCWRCPKLTTCNNVIISSTHRQQRLNRGVELDEDHQNHLTSNLQGLELYELSQLMFIWSDSTSRQVLNFQFLQLLNLDGCANLKSVFSNAIERSLPELTSLSIYCCEELEEIIEETEEPENLSNTEVCFPKLSMLVIKKCNKLKSLFSIAMVGMAPQLRTLHISEAAQLEVVFRHGSEYDTDNRDQNMFSSLERLELEKLSSFVNIFEGFNFEALKLQELSTHECPKFGPILRGTRVEQLEQDVKANQCFQESCPTCGRSGIECSSSQNFMYFESTKAAYDELLEALKDDNAHMIGLYGRGGSGKTTLATEVGGKAKSELKLFDHVISVTVSQTPDIRSIEGKIAGMLESKLQEESEDRRVRQLWLRPRKVKRVLIIVDDVWAKLDLKEIGIRLDDNKNLNLKVLLTTRRREVCELMDCQTQIFLKHLSDRDACSLFHKHANIDSGSSSNLLEVAREVSDECKGLPIAIKAVGSSLKGKGDHEWKVALERLRNPERFDDNWEEGFADAFTCLKLSYDYLRNKEAEVLFLMCSMFPEDHKIFIEDLIRYGVGLGVCGNFDSFDLARSHIKAGINKLVDSCLLFHCEKEHHVKMHDEMFPYEGKHFEEEYYRKEAYVKMHEVVRDVALYIASKSEDRKILVNFCKDLNALAENRSVKDYFAISSWYTKTDLISYQLDAPKLEILLLQIQNKNSQDFSFASSDGVKELKVMSIVNCYNSQSLLLFQSTQWLTNLRTLRLRGWKLRDLSFLISLTRLEALDLRNCRFTELPKGMEKLDKLKLLDLYDCELSENFNYEALASFSQLEELYVVGHWTCPSEVMKDILTLPNLQRFVIQFGWFKKIDYEECIRVLHMREFNISNLGVSKQNLLQRAEDDCLEYFHGGCKNIIPDMVRLVGDMKELKNLGFHYCSEIECLIDTTHHHAEPFQVDTSLPRLVKLELLGMFNLKEMCRGPPSLVLGFFKKLEQLFIRHCRQLHSIFPEACNLCNLKILKIGNYSSSSWSHWGYYDCTIVVSLFSVSVAQSLQQLEELFIEGCKKLKHIITSEGEGGTNSGDNSQLMFPKLKKLSVSYCPKLEFIFPISFDPQGLLQLQEIQISHSSGLKYVFGQYDHEPHSSHGQIMLPSLNVFQLYDLENLLGVCSENYYLSYSSSVKLRCSDCPKLTKSCINVTVSSK